MAVRIPIKTEGGEKAADDLKKVGDAGQQALDRINRASKDPSAGLKALNSATSEVRRGLDDLGGRAGIVGRVISDIGPIGIAAAAGIGAFTLGISEAVAEADKAERARLKIEALLRTTQGASGQTYQSIAAIADSIALSTMATGDAVESAAAKLLTFKSVSGEAFGRTLRVAQDMAAVMGGDVSSAVTQLGKALEDPERNLSALNRSGISFNATQIDTIKHLVEMGDKSRALGEVLKILEGQIGGAGAADAGTLSGAFHHLTERVGMFFENIGKNSGLLEWFTDVVSTAAKGMGVIDEAVFQDLDTRLADKFQELSDARARLEALQNGTTSSGRTPTFSIEQQQRRVAAIEAELKALTDKRHAEAAAASAAQQAAQSARIAATEEQIAANLREQSEERMDELQKDRDARLKKEQAEQQRVNKMRADARASIDGQIESLENEQKALALAERERAIFVELLKAEETARKAGITVTNEQREAIIKETGALFDQKKAIEDKRKADEEATREAEKQAREREKIAEREAEALRRPFEQAAEAVQGVIADGIYDGLNGEIGSVSDFFETFKQIAFRAIAEVAAAMVFKPQIVGTMLAGTSGFASTASAGAQLAQPGGGSLPNVPTTGLGNLAQMGGGYGGAYLGAGAGALYGYQQDGIRGAARYGLAGYAAGAALTSGAAAAAAGWGASASLGAGLAGASSALAAIPGWGWAALAALAVFGSGKKMPTNASAFGIVDVGSGKQLEAPAERNSTEQTRELRDALVNATLAFRSALTNAGATVRGRVGLDVGQRDGIQVAGLGAGQYDDPKAAVAAIFEDMVDRAKGLGAEWKRVFDRLDLNDLEQSVKDIADAGFILNKEYKIAEPLNAAAEALKNIKDNFAPIIDRARELGLAVAPIRAEQNRQIRTLRGDFNQSIDDQILAIVDPLAYALQEFDKIAQDRLDNAEALSIRGRELNDVVELNERERLRIIEQYAGAANDNIEQYLRSITSGSGSFLPPAATLANAEAEFSRLLDLARGGDMQARTDIVGAAQDLRAISRETFGSTEMFFERDQFIRQTLGNLIGQTGSGATFDNIGVTIAQGNASLEYQLVQLNKQVTELLRVQSDQAATIARLSAA